MTEPLRNRGRVALQHRVKREGRIVSRRDALIQRSNLRPASHGELFFLHAMSDLIFTPLECAVLAAICEMHPADREVLESQLDSARLSSRENTGAGFYTRFSEDPSSSSPIRGVRLRESPQFKIDGLKHGMGFILWLKQGYANCLEGYSYDDSTENTRLETVRFEIDKNAVVNKAQTKSPEPPR